jgi:hypothetical protein
MDDRSQDRPEDRRRRGPLGGEENAEETRRVPQARDDEDVATRRSPEDSGQQREISDEEETETRLIRTPGGVPSDMAEPYTDDYPEEAVERREAHLREVYGGVDWLASFIGCVLTVVCGAILLPLAGLVLNPLGFTLDLEERQFDTVVITGLLIIALAFFLSFLIGGYVAGRLARFDGGRNGAATILWAILLSVILLFFGSFLPGALFEDLQDFMESSLIPAIGSLTELGLVGAAIIVGALLVGLLGGFLGGRLGNRYHTRIDYTP